MTEETENPVDQKILKLIRRHHVFTLATVAEGVPWCCSCYFVYDEERNEFLFTSATDTLHGKQMLEHPEVAANLHLETMVTGKIQGLQIKGRVQLLEGEAAASAQWKYIKRFPIAAMMKLTLWSLKPSILKLTDNRLGIGIKLYWRGFGATD